MCRCFSARSYWPVKQSSSKRNVLWAAFPGSLRRAAVRALSASWTFPASRSSLGFIEPFLSQPLVRGKIRGQQFEVVALADRGVERPVVLLRRLHDLHTL